MIQSAPNTLLPPMYTLSNIRPIPQANRLLRRRLKITLLKTRLKNFHTLPNPHIILLSYANQPLLILNLLHSLPSLHNLHQKRIVRDLRALILDIDPMLREQVSCAPQWILQRFVGFVDARAESLGLSLLVCAGAIGMCEALQLDEFFA
jgi:hypothetical protein